MNMPMRLASILLALILGACSGAPAAPSGASSPDAQRTAPIPVTTPPSAGAPSPTVPTPAPTSLSATDLGTITIRDSECAFDQATSTMAPGPVEARVSNETTGVAGAHLWRIGGGHTFAELQAVIDEARAAAESGVPPADHPSYLDGLVSRELPAGESGVLQGEVRAGLHAIVCGRTYPGVGIAAYALLGPIVVRGGSPVARGYHSMTSLGPGRGVMLYGGSTAPPPNGGIGLSDNWTFTVSSGWIESGATSPGVWGDALTYDGGSDRALTLAVGRGNSAITPELWAFDPSADSWAMMTPEPAPTVTTVGRMAYDAESDRTIWFMGAETWAYDVDTDTWTRMHPATSPPARFWHHLAYDAAADRVVLFGGITEPGERPLGDTWAYDFNADAWTLLSADGPPARHYGAMAYDPGSKRIILFGGAEGPWPNETAFDDTWALDVATGGWEKLAPAASPPKRGWHAMAYSEADGKVVLFGGGPSRVAYLADTWLFDSLANTWTRVQP